MLTITNGEMQITTMRHCLIPNRIVSVKKPQKITSVGKDVEKLELLCTIGRKVIWYCSCGKQFGSSSKN